ncbi:ABC transporter permease [Alicyclobacillus acidocaldarius]|uniref:Bacitracin transport permease protein BcrB n=1 Tax=Alicyclobacillus acidocaldarius (strain Tc-4-1) TaxID=1048834 RepID=F8IDA2_ALIAT|nr:ABC transporter permease [Alicyclobacillus acidocaldarius]AEJ42568.1 bacitracin transport permease protein BcrB [Alicyclobacillus acidocaldarius subsp. acidocaldarius Tc-4-1]
MTLWRVVQNEWMKLVRRRRLAVVVALALCLVGMLALGEHHEKQIYSRVPTQAVSADWKANAKTDLAAAQAQLSLLERQSPTSAGAAQALASLQQRVQEDRYRLAHDVGPISPNLLNGWAETSQFVGAATKTFIPLLVVILVGDMVAGEMTQGTIKLLVVRPVRRRTLLFGKWLVSVASSAALSFLLCFAFLGVALAIDGPQGAMQPEWLNVHVRFFTQPGALQSTPVALYDHAVVWPMWHAFLLQSALVAGAMMAVASIAFTCSVLFPSAMVSTSAAMGSIIIGFVVAAMARGQSWVRMLFTTHLSLYGDLAGGTAFTVGSPVTLAQGVAVLLVWTVVLLAAAFLRFGRQDILNA